MSCQDENALQVSSPPEGAIYPTAIWPANTNLSFPRNFAFQEMGSKGPVKLRNAVEDPEARVHGRVQGTDREARQGGLRGRRCRARSGPDRADAAQLGESGNGLQECVAGGAELRYRNFTPMAPNQAWSADLTYIWTDEGWACFNAVKEAGCEHTGRRDRGQERSGKPQSTLLQNPKAIWKMSTSSTASART